MIATENSRDLLEREAIDIIHHHLQTSPEYFMVGGKYVVEIDMLKYLLSNWEIRYQCLGSLEDFLFSCKEFRVFQDNDGGLLVREKSTNNTLIVEEFDDSPCFEITPQETTPPFLGVKIEDLFTFPHEDDEREISYQSSVCDLKDDLRALLSFSIFKGVFRRYGTHEFEKLEWLGDAVLNHELTIMILTYLSPFQHDYLKNELKMSSMYSTRATAARNWTLALIFEELNLYEYMTSRANHYFDFKMKGDIVEVLLGELYTMLHDRSGTSDSIQELSIKILQSIVSFCLYRSQFLLPQEEIDHRIRLAMLPGGGGLRSAIPPVIPPEIIVEEDTIDGELQLPPENLETFVEPATREESLNEEDRQEYQSILEETHQKWTKFITQAFKSSKGLDCVSITKKMRDSIKNHHIFQGNSDLYNQFLADLLALFQGDGLYILSSFDEILPLHPEIYADPVWKSQEAEYWKQLIVKRFTDSHGTCMISGRNIRSYFKANTKLRKEHPEISQKEYLKTIFNSCHHDTTICGKNCDELWPADRDVYSSISAIPNSPNILQQSWFVQSTKQWVSAVLLTFRKTRGLQPFYLRTLHHQLMESKSLPAGISFSDSFQLLEYSLRTHPMICYQYRQYWKDETDLQQGPCFWPIVQLAHKIEISDDHYFLPNGPLRMKDIVDEIQCSICLMNIPIGSRTPIWSTVDEEEVEDYSLCHNCFLLKLQTFLVQKLQLLKKKLPNLFQFHLNNKNQITNFLKKISHKIDFNQLVYSYLGNGTQLLLKLIKISIEKEAIEFIKNILSGVDTNPNVNRITYEGKSAVELKELEKIMKWMEKYQYLGNMEKFFQSNNQIFRVLEATDSGMKLIRERSSNICSITPLVVENDEDREDDHEGNHEGNTEADDNDENINLSPSHVVYINTYQELFDVHKKEFNFQSFLSYDLRSNQYVENLTSEEIKFRTKISCVRDELQILLNEIILQENLLKELIEMKSNECQIMYFLGDSVLHLEITQYLLSLEMIPKWYQSMKQLDSFTPRVLSSLRSGFESIHLISFIVDELQMIKFCHSCHIFEDILTSNDIHNFSSTSSKKLRDKVFRILIGIFYHCRYVAPLCDNSLFDSDIQNTTMYQNGHRFILTLIDLLAYRCQYLMSKYL